MDWWISILAILGLFILRLGVPLAIILLVGYGLRRLDARWQAEAEAQRELDSIKIAPEPPQITLMSEVNQTLPPAQPPLKIEDFIREGFKQAGQPCWVINDCPEATRLQCPAYHQPYTLCWLARRHAIGHIPPECYQCDTFPLKGVMHKN